jgi:hypothetical protein
MYCAFLEQAVRNEMSLFMKIFFYHFRYLKERRIFLELLKHLNIHSFSWLITDLAPCLYIHDLELNFIYKYTKSIVQGHF